MKIENITNEIIRKEIDGEINQDMCSDDIGFALNCKRNVVDIWCNCDCKVNHIKGDVHVRTEQTRSATRSKNEHS